MESVGGSSSSVGGSALLPRLKESTSKDATTDKWNQKGTVSAQTVSKHFHQAAFEGYSSSQRPWVMMRVGVPTRQPFLCQLPTYPQC